MFNNLFEHWIFWLAITLVVLGFLLVARERGFRDKLNGSIDGQKFWLGFKAEWLEKNFSRVMGAIAIAGLVLMMLGCSISLKVEKKEPVLQAEIDALKDDLEILGKASRDETEQVRATLSSALMSCNDKLRALKATK